MVLLAQFDSEACDVLVTAAQRCIIKNTRFFWPEKEVLSWKPDYSCEIVIYIMILNCNSYLSRLHHLNTPLYVLTDEARTGMHAYTPSQLRANELRVFIRASRHSCLQGCKHWVYWLIVSANQVKCYWQDQPVQPIRCKWLLAPPTMCRSSSTWHRFTINRRNPELILIAVGFEICVCEFVWVSVSQGQSGILPPECPTVGQCLF